MSAYIRFRSLDVHRSPGIESAFAMKGFSPSLNLVIGPNGIGKSTVARCLQSLLWPNASPLPGVELVARIDRDEETTEGHLTHAKPRWSGFSPQCGDAKTAERYHLRIDQLLQRSEKAADIHGEVMRELRGGVDIPALQAAFRPKARPQRTALAARASRDSVRSDGQKADHLRAELPALETDLAAANAAHSVLRRLEGTLEVLKAEAALADLQAQLDEVPPSICESKDISFVTLERLDTDRITAQATLVRLTREAETIGIPDHPAPPIDPDRDSALTALREELVRAQDDVRRAAEQRERARTVLESATTELVAAGLEIEALPNLGRAEWQALEAALRAALNAEAALASHDHLARLVPPNPEATDLDAIRANLQRWARWLETPDQPVPRVVEAGSALGPWAAWAVAAGAIVLAAALPEPFRWPAAILAVVLSGVALVLARNVAPKVEQDPVQKPEPGLSREAVVANLDSEVNRLQEALAPLKLHAAGQAFLRQRDPDREQDAARLETANERLREVAGQLHLTPEASAAWLIGLVDAIRRVKESDDDYRRASATVAELESREQGLAAELRQRLLAFGFPPAQTTTEFREQLGQLSRWALANAERERAHWAVADLDQRIADFYAEFDLIPGDRGALDRLAKAKDDYRQLSQAVENQIRVVNRDKEACPEWQTEPPEIDALRAKIEAQQALANRREELQTQVNDLKVKLGEAEKSRAVEQAEIAVKEAEELDARKVSEYADALLARRLVDWLEGTVRDEFEPASLREASELFRRATGQYRVDALPDGFAAIDLESNLRVPLDLLSEGTRLQLLVCVRLGFILTEETSDRPPLLLDEVLANSDENRARELARVVLTIAQSGRQVFYFTSQPSEAFLWLTAAEEMSVDCAIHDLAVIRRRAAIATDLRDFAPYHWEITLPDPNLPWAEYAAALPIPTLDPWLKPGQIPISLLATPDEQVSLHRALSLGAERWATSEAIIREVNLDWHRQMAQRAAVLGAALDAWQVGTLAEPLTVEHITKWPTRNKAQATEVVTQFPQLLRDPVGLLRAVQAAQNIRRGSMQQIEAHLQSDSHYPTEPRLTPDEVRQRTMLRAAEVGLPADEARRLLALLFREAPPAEVPEIQPLLLALE